MDIFDTHCHYNLDPLDTDWQEHWRVAQKNSVTHSIVVGTDHETSVRALEMASHEKNLYASIGYHPGYFQEHSEQFVSNQTVLTSNCENHLQTITKSLENLIDKNPIAIGEIGLDFYRLRSKGLKRSVLIKLQEEALKMQLKIAQTHQLPVILHVRDQEDRIHDTAYTNVLKILEDQTPAKFVLHCASGPIEYIRKALEMGAYIGFDGNLTYQSADHLRKIFEITPKEKVLLETDAPYLAPGLHRGNVCEPWMITETAHFLQDELGADLAQIYQNSFLFFDINKNRIQ